MNRSLPRRGQVAVCLGCTAAKRITARGLCEWCYADKKLRPFAPLAVAQYRYWTPPEKARLRRLRGCGLTVKETARLLGRTVKQVNNQCRALGIRRGRMGPPRSTGRHCWICNSPQYVTAKGWVIETHTRGVPEAYCPACYPAGGFPRRPNRVEFPVFVGEDGPRIYRTPRCA